VRRDLPKIDFDATIRMALRKKKPMTTNPEVRDQRVKCSDTIFAGPC
jgi:hypothetical protein